MEDHDVIHITECPRDAMQGIKSFIPSANKVKYLNALLKCGFDRLDFGSFVSPKAIPQMADTEQVLQQLQLEDTTTELLAIIANERGAKEAVSHHAISFLGYPFSVSETFQQRNTNSSIAESLIRVEEIQNLATKHNKKLLVYLSMAFGNPYGDKWSAELVCKWAAQLYNLGIRHFALADTVGVSDAKIIKELFSIIIPAFKDCEITAHLHARKEDVIEKTKSALEAGCRSFDGAINGIGGCPMASDALTGNMDTELMLSVFNEQNYVHHVDNEAFTEASKQASNLFSVFVN